MLESWGRESAFAPLLGGQVERRFHKILAEPASSRSKEEWVGNTFEYEDKIKIMGQWKPQKLIGGFVTCGLNAT